MKHYYVLMFGIHALSSSTLILILPYTVMVCCKFKSERYYKMVMVGVAVCFGKSSFFGEMSSNECRPPVNAGVSWWSAMAGGCRVQQSPVERLSGLQKTNSQGEGVPVGNGPRKKWMFENLYWACTEDYGRRLLPLCPHLCEKHKSLKPFNFNNSNQLMPDLRFQQSWHDN